MKSLGVALYVSLFVLAALVIGCADNDGPEEETLLTRAEAAADLDQLAELIENRSSYIYSVDFDYRGTVEKLKKELPPEVPRKVLGLEIQELLQHLGDNHAKVDGWEAWLSQRFSPAKFGFRQDRVFAYWPDRSGLVDPGHPYVRAIDGVPIERWIGRAGDITSGPTASESQRWARSIDLMRYIRYMRSELGLEDPDSVALELESEDGQRVVTQSLPVAEELTHTEKAFGLGKESRFFPGNIGYLRIYSQRDDDLLESIDGWMKRFRDTRALIIDARQCGGGRRSNLQVLFPYFMSPDDPPYIANVAMLRVPEGETDFDPRGKLGVGDKKLKFVEDDDVTTEERDALEEFLLDFEPQFHPPKEKFAGWYFMAMTAKPGKYFYDKPVYLIMDWGVGSAGDIFVSTFKGWRNVTLVGTPSNGRSGNSRAFELSNSGIPARISTMASFQKTGAKYDNVGIAPDIHMEAEISDWLGQSDTILDRVHSLVVQATE